MLKLLPKSVKNGFDKPKLTVKAVFEYLLITAFVKAEKYFLNIR